MHSVPMCGLYRDVGTPRPQPKSSTPIYAPLFLGNIILDTIKRGKNHDQLLTILMNMKGYNGKK